jgi:Flp pilus assembly protein TadB
MVVMEEDGSVPEQLANLERRLAEYHARLTEAARERDEFVYDVAWGLGRSVNAILALASTGAAAFLAYIVAADFLERQIALVAALLVFIFAYWWVGRRSIGSLDDANTKDKKAMAAFPEWETSEASPVND